MESGLPSQRNVRLTEHNGEPAVPTRALRISHINLGPIQALTYSSGSGQYLLSGSSDRTINLYNPAKACGSSPAAALIQSFKGVHAYEVLSIAVSTDNSRFTSAGGDQSVFLWDVATAQTLRRFGPVGGRGRRVECLAFAGEGDSIVMSGGFDGAVRMWDARSQNQGKPIMALEDAHDSVTDIKVGKDAEFVTGGLDGRLRWYDVRMGMFWVDFLGRRSSFALEESSTADTHTPEPGPSLTRHLRFGRTNYIVVSKPPIRFSPCLNLGFDFATDGQSQRQDAEIIQACGRLHEQELSHQILSWRQ